MFFVLAQVLSSLPLRRPSSQVITFSIRSVQICSSVHSAHLSLVPSLSSILRRPVFFLYLAFFFPLLPRLFSYPSLPSFISQSLPFFPFHLTFMIEFPDAFRLFSPFHISLFSCLSLPLQSFLLLMNLFPFSFLPLHSKQASSPHS